MVPTWLDILVFHTWWRFSPRESPWIWQPYHWFNLFEGCVWMIFAGLLVRRALAGRRALLEGVYALAFATFGLTDFREAYALSSWLIWLKLLNLIALWQLRAVVIRRYYPESRLTESLTPPAFRSSRRDGRSPGRSRSGGRRGQRA